MTLRPDFELRPDNFNEFAAKTTVLAASFNLIIFVASKLLFLVSTIPKEDENSAYGVYQ
jgi:hypothetical protein